MATGDSLTVVGQTPDGDWLLLESGAWIAAFLVDEEVSGVAAVEPTATPTLTPTATPRPTATPTSIPPSPTPSPMPTAAPTVAWYSGGTLHHATWAEWRRATDANQLATAADWITAAYEPEWRTLDELRFLSNELIACLDEVESTVIEAGGGNTAVTDYAALCIILMMDQ